MDNLNDIKAHPDTPNYIGKEPDGQRERSKLLLPE